MGRQPNHDNKGGMKMDRDPRWEDIRAYKGPVQLYSIEEDYPRDREDLVEFEIEVRYNGRVYWQKQYAHKNTLTDVLIDNFEKFLFNEMIEALDRFMDEEGVTRNA